jgi:hypothetical protein
VSRKTSRSSWCCPNAGGPLSSGATKKGSQVIFSSPIVFSFPLCLLLLSQLPGSEFHLLFSPLNFSDLSSGVLSASPSDSLLKLLSFEISFQLILCLVFVFTSLLRRTFRFKIFCPVSIRLSSSYSGLPSLLRSEPKFLPLKCYKYNIIPGVLSRGKFPIFHEWWVRSRLFAPPDSAPGFEPGFVLPGMNRVMNA